MVGEHTISVVVPVYRGELTLQPLVDAILALTQGTHTPAGRPMRVAEVLLVHDAGPDHSDVVIRELSKQHDFVHPVWLSRNFGQHAATIAGMSSSGSEWIVTLDEDGQFDPADIGKLLDTALDRSAQLVYGVSTTKPPHGVLRNAASSATKFLATRVLSARSLSEFSSFRLMVGEVGRGVAAYVGPDVYLDVALSWAFGAVASCPVEFRNSTDRESSYSYRRLFSHFWHLFVSVGPRSLRVVSLMGLFAAFVGFVIAVIIFVEKVTGHIKVTGWASLAVLVLLSGGMTLFALGILAEYLGAAVRMAMGKPLYLIVSDPATGPLSRSHVDTAARDR